MRKSRASLSDSIHKACNYVGMKIEVYKRVLFFGNEYIFEDHFKQGVQFYSVLMLWKVLPKEEEISRSDDGLAPREKIHHFLDTHGVVFFRTG